MLLKLAVFALLAAFALGETPTCAIEIVDSENVINVVELPTGTIQNTLPLGERVQALAVDRTTSTIYTLHFASGNIYKSNLQLTTLDLLGNVGNDFLGAYYNCKDGLIYAVKNINDADVYTIDPATLTVTNIGTSAADSISKTGILVSKDGTKVYVLDWSQASIWEHPIDNVNPGNGVEYDINIPGDDSTKSMSWYNLEPDDYNIIVSQNSFTPSRMYRYNIMTQDQELLYETSRWVTGIEAIYGFECHNLPAEGEPTGNLCESPRLDCSEVDFENKCSDYAPCLHENPYDNTCFNKINYAYDYTTNSIVTGCPAGTLYCTKNGNQNGCGRKDCSPGSCVHDVEFDETCFANNFYTNSCPPGTSPCPV